MNEAQRNEKLRDWKSQKGIPKRQRGEESGVKIKDLEKRKEGFFSPGVLKGL